MTAPLGSPATSPHLQRQADRLKAVSLRATSQAALSTSRFGIGVGLAGALLLAHSLWRFSLHVADYPRLVANISAWALLLVVLVIVGFLVRRTGFALSDRVFTGVLAGLAIVVALDLYAVWGVTGSGLYPTASIAVGGVLVGTVTLRPARDILIATGALGVALTVTLVWSQPRTPLTFGAEMLMVALAVATPVIASIIIGGYRRVTLLALDRVLIQSTVNAPAYGLGVLDSEEIAALDREVEELFDDVASGREPLPLSPDRAEQAAALATELRRHLVAGHHNTWLYHAVTESDFLRGSISIDDPDAIAAQLDQVQRDGLLSAVWLLIQSSDPAPAQAHIAFGPVHTVHVASGAERRCTIEILMSGVDKNKVEPTTWTSLKHVGGFIDTPTQVGLRVELTCVLDRAEKSS